MNTFPAERFVVVSSYFPPIAGGTSTVIDTLLSAFPSDAYAVISQSPDAMAEVSNSTVRPGVHVRRWHTTSRLFQHMPYGTRLNRLVRYATLSRISAGIVSEVKRLRAGRIIAVYPSWPFLMAAWSASRSTGVPLCIYSMDCIQEPSQFGWPDTWTVKRFARRIMTDASVRLVLSPALVEHTQRRFGLDSRVIPHAVRLDQPPPPPYPNPDGRRLIVHTGVIEQLQPDGLRRMAAVIRAHPEWNARLVLCTPTPLQEVIHHGITPDDADILSLPTEQVRSLQSSASLLVAVMSFEWIVEVLCQTAFPTKVVEYMTTGVPILAHAPPDSYFAGHVRQHGYALLAENTSLGDLETRLQSALNDPSLRARLVQAAQRTVHEQFSLESVAERFAAACGIASPSVNRRSG